MKRITLLMVTILLGVASLWARPGYSKPVDVRQPDGTTVTLLMRGDEFLSFMTTTDGYTVVKGKDGFYRYAEKDGDGLKASAFVAKNAEKRTADELTFLAGKEKGIHAKMSEAGRQFQEQASRMYSAAYHHTIGKTRRVPPPGAFSERINYDNFKGLVVLVNWNDREFAINDPHEFYQKLTSQKNYTDDSKTVYPFDVKGSVRDYFYDNSMGIFDPTFDVVGPITIDYSCEYCWPVDENGNTKDGSGIRMRDILKAILDETDKMVDFNDYDLNNDGNIDLVYIIFAGYGSYVQGNNMKYIWPHASDYSGMWEGKTYAYYYGMDNYDGKSFGRYACSVEIQDYEELASEHQYPDGIGTMCHEFSHVLGLADHYDVRYSGATVTPGQFDIMDGGADFNQGLCPVGYNAFERRILGFADNSITTLEEAGTYQLEPLNTSNTAYIVNTANEGEVFYVENRQNTGWDECLPAAGLLVWRADTSHPEKFISNSVNIIPGEECFQLLNSRPIKTIDLTGDIYPVWRAKGATLDLYDISETDNVISFTAGKDIYPSIIEDFEDMPLTETDVTGLTGKFCQWNLENAQIVQAGDYGNGQHVAQIGCSGKLESSILENGLRTMLLTVKNSPIAKITLLVELSDDGINWETGLSVEIPENKSCVRHFKNIPAGNAIRMRILSDNSDAVAYIDDIKVTLPKETDGISTLAADKVQKSEDVWYSISGMRVPRPTKKGLYICNGTKVVVR